MLSNKSIINDNNVLTHKFCYMAVNIVYKYDTY